MKVFLIYVILLLAASDGFSETYYISPKIGSDENSGEQTMPFRTINKAISILKDGDRIILMAGEYYENITIERKHNISISAFGDGSAILYGVHQGFINNKTYPWKFLRKEKNKYWNNVQYIYAGHLPKVNQRYKLPDYYDQFNYIFDKNGKQLYGYRFLEEFKKRDKQNTDGEGYWFSKDSVYVAVNDPYNERYNSLYISRTGSIIRNLACNRLIIDGGENNLIKFKYSGRYAYSAEGNIAGSIIKNVHFEDCNTSVYLFGVTGKEFLIENCKFIYRSDPRLIWQDIKTSFLESTGIAYANGTLGSLTVRNSHLEGVFNGIVAMPGQTILSHNMFIDIGDDAIELDGDAVDVQVNDNYFIDCFTAFSLCPVEKGPVYIYNNFIFSQRVEFPYESLKNGKLRNTKPKTLKFWNLPNGKTLKDGKQQKVSGNIHFYYNTVIARDQPLSIGILNNKALSPINSTFYNNIFYSENTLTNSTGYSEDGIDIDNNIFFASIKNRNESQLFIGWNGENRLNLKNSNNWTDNIYQKIEFEKLVRINEIPQKSPYVLCEKDRNRIRQIYRVKKLPDFFPSSNILNNRELPGAI